MFFPRQVHPEPAPAFRKASDVKIEPRRTFAVKLALVRPPEYIFGIEEGFAMTGITALIGSLPETADHFQA
jgi:hypothetical protein